LFDDRLAQAIEWMVFERADALLHEALDRHDPRRSNRAARFAEVYPRRVAEVSKRGLHGGEKPMTEELVERLAQSRDKIAMTASQ
jgi:hypothetical protein